MTTRFHLASEEVVDQTSDGWVIDYRVETGRSASRVRIANPVLVEGGSLPSAPQAPLRETSGELFGPLFLPWANTQWILEPGTPFFVPCRALVRRLRMLAVGPESFDLNALGELELEGGQSVRLEGNQALEPSTDALQPGQALRFVVSDPSRHEISSYRLCVSVTVGV